MKELIPEITVLMPVYNAEKYLRRALESVLNQTFKNFEFLIINDGSTDTTVNIINSYNDPRIRIVTQENAGVAKALNKGLNLASCELIARIDADDICTLDRLEKQVDFMNKNPEYIVIGSDCNAIDENGEFIYKQVNISYEHEDILKTMYKYCPFMHTSVMLRKSFALKVGGYPERAHNFEDHLLWIKMSSLGKFKNFTEVLGSFSINPESVTMDDRDMGEEFGRLKRKAIETGEITEQEELRILVCKNRFSPREKRKSYYRMVAKKYLWNNYEPRKARKHLIKVIKMEPLKMSNYFLLGMSFLPQQLIMYIYKKVKE